MTLTYKVTLDRYSVELYIFDILDPKNLQNKKDHRSNVTRTRDNKGHAQGHVTLRYRVTLDRTRDNKVTVWKYIYLTSLTLKTCKTKKDHRSNVTRTRDNKGHAQGHVTLRYRVTLDSYSVELYIFDILDPKNLQNKKKDHRSSVIRTRNKKGHVQSHAIVTYKVTL